MANSPCIVHRHGQPGVKCYDVAECAAVATQRRAKIHLLLYGAREGTCEGSAEDSYTGFAFGAKNEAKFGRSSIFEMHM
eukprot:SAG31_NODE_4349_length_3324_cov_6.508217_2_plen_79_part_00